MEIRHIKELYPHEPEACEVYQSICKILKEHGFEQNENLDMVRPSTGCSFPVEYLINCKSVLDFQLEYSYA
jgi:coproporphyrinogen III oxidase-like Fe-S oxidoreductase